MEIELREKDEQIAYLLAQVSQLKELALKSAELQSKVETATSLSQNRVEEAMRQQKANENEVGLVYVERDDLRKKLNEVKDDNSKLTAEVSSLYAKLEQAQKENANIRADLEKSKQEMMKEVARSKEALEKLNSIGYNLQK
eukprot:TRINITY_DN4865_c0_g1_i1.p1 TRINITY_DN4865_c0_g1~~TRINITY_DN4865_c0_g1_i1.p1  ORF type:complete len:141 (-),score=55.54 TRINITY_DN4865_c0_g1_i1:63-485(-)